MPHIVVSSVQTIVRRLDKFDPNRFDLVIVDEAHHAIAETYRKILDHFNAKVLGVTATPDRGDKKALGQVFEDVAYRYDVGDAISDGWLVPIEQRFVEIEGLDVSKCRTTAGDLNAKDLTSAVTDFKVMEQMAQRTIALAGDRPSLFFAVTVAHAHAIAEVLQSNTKHLVRALDGKTDKDERREVVQAFRDGEVRYLVNCALFTEGFDAPSTALVAMGRLTKSRSLYEQMIGRGTRTLDGTLEGLNSVVPDVRRAKIHSSGKENLLVLDFVGNSGKHSLISMIDVLGGDASPPEKSIAKKLLESGEVTSVEEAISLAREELAKQSIKYTRERAKKDYKTVIVDPFIALGAGPRGEDMLGRPASERQQAMLSKCGINPAGLDKTQARKLISQVVRRRSQNLGTYKQVNRLMKKGLDGSIATNLSFQNASELITRLAANNWRAPVDWSVWVKGLRK